MFPSPSGLSLFLTFKGRDTYVTGHAFPSPSGLSLFLIEITNLLQAGSYYFPSPSGLSLFLMLLKILYIMKWIIFRPLRGFLYF